ncbi:MAG: hypothetical protein P4L36_02475 [Holophaga sp.]|nr:hypothetical protein [Holophaga sp.]
MMIRRFCIPLLLAASLFAGEVSPDGAKLAERFCAMDVEHHWLPGHRLADWRTGDPSPRRGSTHCSAFLAAACERIGVDMLHPPEHGENYLATAQAEWLRQEGPRHGWSPVASPFLAQDLANRGQVVVVLYPSPDPARSGHAALVLACTKSEAQLDADGPQIIQAGAQNASSTTVREGFRHHRGAWVSGHQYRVLFFSCAPLLPDGPVGGRGGGALGGGVRLAPVHRDVIDRPGVAESGAHGEQKEGEEEQQADHGGSLQR